jgi:hypothetical protein
MKALWIASLQQSHVPTDAWPASSHRKHGGETSHRAHKLESLSLEAITNSLFMPPDGP